MTEEMDAVDRRQQAEIEDLKVVNQRQDGYIKNMIWAFVLFALIQFCTSIMLINSVTRDCPHEGCPHHQGAK